MSWYRLGPSPTARSQIIRPDSSGPADDTPAAPAANQTRETSEPGRGAGPGSDAGADEGRLTPLREMQLLDAHRVGDADALATLLAAYQRRIYAVCYRMVGNPDTASDLTQDSLVKIIAGLDGYDGRSAFSTWAIRVTMNSCLSHLRRERVRRTTSLDDPLGTDDEPRGGLIPGEGELPAPDRVEHSEMTKVLLRALGGLDATMRAILVLRDLQELEYQQIGDVLDIPVGTVKSRLFRARAALREATERELAAGPDPA